MKIWTEISAERLSDNFSALQRIVAQASQTEDGTQPPALLAVVKANAYGHGISPCAAILAAAGAEWLGVTDAQEGAIVRGVLTAAGIPEARQPRVLVMSGTAALPGEAESIVRHHLTPVAWSAEHLAALASAGSCTSPPRAIGVHLEIDTGMSRQGVLPGPALSQVLSALQQTPQLALDGVLTHFASTEVVGSTQTRAQEDAFAAAIAQIRGFGLFPRWLHVGNSSYIDNSGVERLRWLQSAASGTGARAMVRSGLALYGYLLPAEGTPFESPPEPLVQPHVLPVLTWKTRVIAIAEVPHGAAVGYNGTFIATRPMRLALLPAGYADGLRRELSSTNARPGGWVIIRGRRAPIVGRVSMNLTTVDVTGIDDVVEGDEALLLGDCITARESSTAQDHARLAGTIAYEILCGIRSSPRSARLARPAPLMTFPLTTRLQTDTCAKRVDLCGEVERPRLSFSFNLQRA